MMASVEQREVLRCDHCSLVQFRTASAMCRRCHKALEVENGKAMPTLSSLDRLARALKVDIGSLLRDANTRHRDETAVLTADPFLAEIAAYTSQLDPLQRSIFLNHVRELAAGRRRSA